jgi:sn-glycerol 3-phosphate transport system ATP-binding protein
MGRAIVREPAVFLFDEPLSNLDAKLRVQMRLEIKKLQRQLGTTSIYVTHDQVEAMTLADRLIVMNAGVAEQIGTPIEVYERPATAFVAGFIGSPSMNFLPATLGPNAASVSLGGRDQLLLGKPLANAAAGMPVTLGLRPEHLLPTEGSIAVELRVDLVEPLGADTLAHGHFSAIDTDVTVRLPGNAQVAAGDVLKLAAAPARMHVFDRETGQRLS